MPRKRILILSFSPLATDPRVNRQIELLARDHEVVAAGFSAPRSPDVSYVALSSRKKSPGCRIDSALRLLGRRHDSYYWRIDSVSNALALLKDRSFDLIIANDADTWPLACAIRGRARLLFDAHEFAPREFEDVWWWRLLYQPYKRHLCANYLPRADASITVCRGLADEYARVFGVSPSVVRNMPVGTLAAPGPVRPDAVRLVHHGLASPSRHIEVMIELMHHLDERFTLDLMLVGPADGYFAKLRSLAAPHRRVRFVPPVPADRIVASTGGYDIGLFLLPPVNFNYRHALPNKFFEFVQARLAIAIGPSPEMARLVREHGLGVVAADFTPRTLAAALNALTTDQIDAFKAASHRAAPLLSWDHERELLRTEIDRLLALPPCAA